ncbi:hypothetical protein [Sphaerisporangium dianthi]|uniref:Uncharacterized protein n=1 Tax=Sphaerisporangium dianthi TaxID=1436120 RepID=A0ABV9CEU3_9ACTN
MSNPQYVIVTFRRPLGDTGQPGRQEWPSSSAVTAETFAVNAGGPEGDGEGDGGAGLADVSGVCGEDGGDAAPDGGPEVGVGSAATPEPAPPHAVAVAHAQASTTRPRPRCFGV